MPVSRRISSGSALIGKRQAAAAVLHSAEQLLRIPVHLEIGFLAKTEIQLSIRLDGCNAGGDRRADRQRADQLAFRISAEKQLSTATKVPKFSLVS
jgi:hypothetical protein